MSLLNSLTVRQFKREQAYFPIWNAMREFTDQRDCNTPDELWILEHSPIFTQGSAGKAEHIIDSKNIPVIQTDRGGQVTYHGPGQMMFYTLFNLKRLEFGIRFYVHTLEQCILDYLQRVSLNAHRQEGAPGVYVDSKKICSIGLRVRKGCSYHGLALNVKMDLSPFKLIHPCGYKKLLMTDLSEWLNPMPSREEMTESIVSQFKHRFHFENITLLEASDIHR